MLIVNFSRKFEHHSNCHLTSGFAIRNLQLFVARGPPHLRIRIWSAAANEARYSGRGTSSDILVDCGAPDGDAICLSHANDKDGHN